MDDLDHRLIAELRINGRASVPVLAQILGVARGTVQSRLNKLLDSGVIKGFTVKLRDGERQDIIKAIMMIELGENNCRATINSLKKIPGLSEVSTTNGKWDLIANVEVSTMQEINQLITDIRAMDGIRKSETFLQLGPA
ncbi:Lrp/AsnC family transcriptional regulator [Curvivirga sp.]|uniref:Lrp/AsnC family transcriptional regulator n=1 Tax=Curvivirga sp. TaxID=2856848 RepID=UPI003B58D85D